MSFKKIVPCTEEIKKKAIQFDNMINEKPLRLYTIRPNNLFGLKGGLVFTGNSLDIAVEKVIDNALPLAFFKVDEQEERIKILRKIKSVAKALTLDNIIFGLNGKKRSEAWIETAYDVQKSDSLRYNDLSFDSKLNECSYYCLEKNEEKWVNED